MPVDLTPAQQVQIVQINRTINRQPHTDDQNQGRCAQIALAKRDALIAAGIPADDLMLKLVRVSAPIRMDWVRRASYHELLQINATVHGRAWIVSLDMNSDEPVTPEGERALGYQPLDGDQ